VRIAARTSIVLILLVAWTIVAVGPAGAQAEAPPDDFAPPPPDDFGPPPDDLWGPPPTDEFHDDLGPPPEEFGPPPDDLWGPPPTDDFFDDVPPPDDFHDDLPPPPPGDDVFVQDSVVVEVFFDDLYPADPFAGGLPPDVPPEYAFFVDPTLPVPAGFEWLDDPTLPVPAEYAFLYDPTLPVPAEFDWLLGPAAGSVPVDQAATPEPTAAPQPTAAPTAEVPPEPTTVGVADAVPADGDQDDGLDEVVRDAMIDREDGVPEDTGRSTDSSEADGEPTGDDAEASSDPPVVEPEQESKPTSLHWEPPTASTDESAGARADAGDPDSDEPELDLPALAAADGQPVRVVTGAPASGMLVPLLVFVALASIALAASIPVILRRRPSGHDELRELALTDDLTKLANRRRLDRDLEAHRQGERPIAIAMIDIDHFKKLNDDFGHATGDRVLQRVAAALADNIRGDDIVYRYGGEEFCILLPDTSEHEAAAVVDRVRRVIEELRFEELDRAVTISAGVAESAPFSNSGDRERPAHSDRQLVELADAALYAAKHAGRNRVALSSLSG